MKRTWESLITLWVARILGDPGWRVRVLPSDTVEAPATAITDAERFVYREATVRYRPDALPDNRIACHEVCHIAVAAVAWPGIWAMQKIATEANATLTQEWVTNAEEQVVEGLTRAFLAAYGEED